jgi:hypothetical protein
VLWLGVSVEVVDELYAVVGAVFGLRAVLGVVLVLAECSDLSEWESIFGSHQAALNAA